MDEYPDIYGDGFTLGISQFGITLTITLTQPENRAGPQEMTAVPVVRLRMSRELGKTLVEHLTNALANAGPQAPTSTVKH